MDGQAAAETLRGQLVHVRGRSPLYERLLAGLSGAAERGFDGGVIARLLCMAGPVGPYEARLLLMAALHRAALDHPDLPHAEWYPQAMGAAVRPPDSGAPGALALAYLVEHEDGVATFMRGTRIQTNEVGRCVALLPGILEAGQFGLPLRLFELGASAGLNLHLDHYHYRYDGGPSWGPNTGPVLATRAEGRVPRSLAPPTLAVTERRGVDLRPLDVHDDDHVRNLHAFIWAEPDRHERLAAALAIARAEPVTIDKGDLIAWATDRCRPADQTTTVVFQSQVRHLLSSQQRDELGATIEGLLRAASPSAPVVHVAFEAPRGIKDDGASQPEVTVGIGDGSGPPTWTTIASADWHGRWMRWF